MKSITNRRTCHQLAGAIALVGSLLVGGCKDSYDHIVLDLVATPVEPERVILTSEQIALPEGQAIVFHAYAESRKDKVSDGDSLEFIVVPPDIGYVLERASGTSEFVLVGTKAGRGTIKVVVDGDYEDDIELIVLPGT